MIFLSALENEIDVMGAMVDCNKTVRRASRKLHPHMRIASRYRGRRGR
jgi:hypothetical protein